MPSDNNRAVTTVIGTMVFANDDPVFAVEGHVALSATFEPPINVRSGQRALLHLKSDGTSWAEVLDEE